MKAWLFICMAFLAYPLAAQTSTSSDQAEVPYIPYDVTDAVREISRVLAPEDKGKLSSKPVAMQFRNRWRLWHADGRLTLYFYGKGLYNADLMWQIIATAFEANQTQRSFDLKAELRRVLSEYGSWTNIPKELRNAPAEFAQLRISHYIQRDDLAAIHVFSTAEGVPQWTYIRDAGWARIDSELLELLSKSSAIVVQHLPEGPSQSGDQKSIPDIFDAGR